MPLAIELAAARSSSLGLDGLLAGLDDHLRVLSRSGAHADRHSSMRTVIDWSHQLLDDEERAMFRRLGAFAGSFDLYAAATVASAGDVAVATDLIGRLADKSLLARGQDAAGSRWRMLDTVRAYAGEQLDVGGEAAEVRRRHLSWAAATAHGIEQSLDNDAEWQDRFDSVSDDLRAALQGAPRGGGDGTDFVLALALGHLSYARRFLVEARDHLDEAVLRAPDDASAVPALRYAAGIAFAEMRGEAAFTLLQTELDSRFGVPATPEASAITLAGRGHHRGAVAQACSLIPFSHEELVQVRSLIEPGPLHPAHERASRSRLTSRSSGSLGQRSTPLPSPYCRRAPRRPWRS